MPKAPRSGERPDDRRRDLAVAVDAVRIHLVPQEDAEVLRPRAGALGDEVVGVGIGVNRVEPELPEEQVPDEGAPAPVGLARRLGDLPGLGFADVGFGARACMCGHVNLPALPPHAGTPLPGAALPQTYPAPCVRDKPTGRAMPCGDRTLVPSRRDPPSAPKGRRRVNANSQTPPVERREIVSWAMYDFAHSAFGTLVVTFIFSAYYARSIATDPIEGAIWWTRAVNASAIITALIMPVVGAVGDFGGLKKRFLLIATAVCVALTAGLFRMGPGDAWIAALVFVGASVAYESLQSLANAFLPELSTRENMGRISGLGWGLGYFGGLLCLILALGMVTSWLPEAGGLKRARHEPPRRRLAARVLDSDLPLPPGTAAPPPSLVRHLRSDGFRPHRRHGPRPAALPPGDPAPHGPPRVQRWSDDGLHDGRDLRSGRVRDGDGPTSSSSASS